MNKHKGLRKSQTEPSMIRAGVVAVLGLLASLGFSWAAHVDKGTLTAIVAVITVLLPLLQGAWTRFAVTANAKVVSRVTTDGHVVAGEAALAPTGSRLPAMYPTTTTTTYGSAVIPMLPTVTAQVNPGLVAGPLTRR